MNIGGLGEESPFFAVFFANGDIVQPMQWSCLILSSILASQVSVIEGLLDRRHFSAFSVIFAGFLGLLVMEDAGNLRNIIGEYLSYIIPDSLSILHSRAGVYALYSAIPLYAVLRYDSPVLSRSKLALVFWSGVITYALAGLLGGIQDVFGFYREAGQIVNESLFHSRLSPEATGWLMDSLIEETIEMIGAILFLAFYTQYRIRLDVSQLR